ncbi:hypothetical protein YC2023_060078 [Brassica napus]
MRMVTCTQVIKNEQLNLTVLTRGYGSRIRVKGDASPVDHRSRLMIMVWINDGLGEINAMNVTARNESVMAGASPPLLFPKAWILHIEQEGKEKPIWRREEMIGEVEKKRKWLMRLPRRKKGKQTNKLNVILRDENASNLTCTLWGDYGKQVIHYVEENNNSIVVCVVRFTCVTEYKGVHCISNVFNATQLIFDPPGPHFDDFRSKLPKNDIVLSRDDGLSGSTVSWYVELFTKNPRKTLREILRNNEIGKYVITATVNSVETNPRWYYIVCVVCEKTVHPIEENPGDEEGPVTFDCLQCNRNVTEVLVKFKLVLLVTDDSTEEAKFLIFDNIAYPFLNKTADEFAEEVAEDATISYADDASQCSIMKNGNNKRLGVMDDGVNGFRSSQLCGTAFNIFLVVGLPSILPSRLAFFDACVSVTLPFAMFATSGLDSVLLGVSLVDLEDCLWSQVWAHVSRGISLLELWSLLSRALWFFTGIGVLFVLV